MQHDKKIADGKIGWVLPDRMGSVLRRDDVAERTILDALSVITP